MIRLSVFSDDAVLVNGVRFALRQIPDVILGHICTDSAKLASVAREHRPDVFLLDVLPAVSLSLLEDIRKASPGCRIVLWARSVASEFAHQAMALGIRGILRRTLPESELIQCIRKVAADDVYFEPSLTSGFFSKPPVKLTRRETQLVCLLAQGLRNKEIAYLLSLSEGTVKVYLSRLFEKLGVNDRFELALFAMRHLNAGDPPANLTSRASAQTPATGWAERSSVTPCESTEVNEDSCLLAA